MQIIGNGVVGKAPQDSGLGGALNSIASLFMDTGQGQARAAALAQAARQAAGQGQLGHIFAQGINAPGYGGAAVANGVPLDDVAKAGQLYAALHGGVADPTVAALQNGSNHYAGSYAADKQSQDAAAALAAQAQAASATAAAAARSGTAVKVLRGGVPTLTTQGALQPGDQPLMDSPTAVGGAAAQAALLPRAPGSPGAVAPPAPSPSAAAAPSPSAAAAPSSDGDDGSAASDPGPSIGSVFSAPPPSPIPGAPQAPSGPASYPSMQLPIQASGGGAPLSLAALAPAAPPAPVAKPVDTTVAALPQSGVSPDDARTLIGLDKDKESLPDVKNHIVGPGGTMVDKNGHVLFQNNALAMDPGGIELAAERLVQGDPNALTGLGRAATAGDLTSIYNRAAQIAAQRPGGGAPLNAAGAASNVLKNKQDYAGELAGARTSGTLTARLDTYATEAAGALSLASEASAALPRGQWTPINAITQLGQAAAGNPAFAQFNAANTAVINTYAKALNPTGTPLDSDKTRAAAMLSTAQSPEAYQAVLNQLQREVNIAHNAARNARSNERAGTGSTLTPVAPISGGAPPAPQAAPQAAAPARLGANPDADFQALAPGAQYIGPDNILRTK